MSDRYPFTGDKTLITHDGAFVWSEQVAVQSSLDFSNTSDSTLTDSMNESYATAVEDNETQYLSVLETTSDITLEDLHNLTLGISKVGTQEVLEFNNENNVENLDANGVNMGDQQVVVFSLDGSDDLYGIQITQDEEGNVQKYQFKFRSTDDGQLEAIPESIELLPNDEEAQDENIANVNEVLVQEIETDETEEQEASIFFSGDVQDGEVQETQMYIQQEQEEEREYVEFQQEEENFKVYIKGEKADFGDREYDEGQEEQVEEMGYQDTETEVPQEEHYEEIVDVKAGILEESMALRNASTNIKHELLQEDHQEATTYSEESQDYPQYENNELAQCDAPYDDDTITEEQSGEHSAQDENYATVETKGSLETMYVSADPRQVYEGSDATDCGDIRERNRYEHVFVQESHVPVEKSMEINAGEEGEEAEERFVGDIGVENDSDNDDYQIVEGLHITAEGDIDEDAPSPLQEPETILQEVVEKPPVTDRANILKQTSLLKPMKEIKPKINKTVVYYVVPHLEKENVNSMPINNTTTYRPIRSNPRTVLKSSFVDIKDETEVKASVADERLNKRFARSKEAVQARLFNNFISKTTIPHAPVRQTRLPRKQQIRPVDTRRNEEIIVQEVMVSSKGFIENIEERLKNKDKLEVTEYVVLTDSDDDYDPKQGTKKKKKHKKHKKPDAGDTDSDISIIEIRSDDEPADDAMQQEKDKESPKRGRGRPKKSPDIESTDSMKRRRGRPPKSGVDQEESPTKKSRTESDEEPTKKEIKCPHCTKTFPSQNSLSTHIQHHNLENSLRSKLPTIEYKHKCDDCLATFKNSILLKRHVCDKRAPPARTRLECVLCKKTYPTVQALNVHKRSHVKENLVNTTSLTRVSPKKSRPSTSRFKSPRRVTESRVIFKCNECCRVCYSQESLALHEKTHRKYACVSCKATFPSRLLLDTHVRVSCVKTASPSSRRLSFKIRKSYVQSPRRNSIRFGRRSVMPNLSSVTAGRNSVTRNLSNVTTGRNSVMRNLSNVTTGRNSVMPNLSSVTTGRNSVMLNLSSVTTGRNSVMPNSSSVTAGMNSTVVGLDSTLDLKLECSSCGEKFQMFQDKFKHQVKVHGLETPDKSILTEQKKRLHKPKNVHGGIPARDNMRKAFANIKSKIALVTPTKDVN